MSAHDLAFGRRVTWQGHAAEVIDILLRAHPHRVRVQIRMLDQAGRPVRWVRLAELEEPHA